MGARNVVITGIEGKNNKIVDFVLEKIQNIGFQEIKLSILTMAVDVIIQQP